MKRLFFLVTGMLGAAALQAQIKQGTIIYERKTDVHRTIQDEQMKAMMPQFRTSRHMLLFSDSVSVYKIVPEDEAPDPFAGGDGGMRMMIRNPGDAGELYKNFAQARSIQATELGGKNFLIVDTIQQQPWKLGTETRQVLGHTCHKATRKMNAPMMMMRMSIGAGGNQRSDSSRQQPKEIDVIAWYADDIISPVGPENHGQLPGVILELDTDNGATVFTATEIKATVEQKELREPKKGKTVTRSEYQKIAADLMSRQMQSMPGGVRLRMD